MIIKQHFFLIENNYEHTPKACVSSHNIVLYPNLSLEGCKITCNERSDCLAFEYGVSYGGTGKYKPKDCHLQSANNKAGCDGAHHNLDLYVKKGMIFECISVKPLHKQRKI